MSGRATMASSRRRQKAITYLWVAAFTILTICLLYWEMTALLYILGTLSVTALLIVVALSDLGGSEKLSAQIPPAGDAATTGGGITSTYGINQPR